MSIIHLGHKLTFSSSHSNYFLDQHILYKENILLLTNKTVIYSLNLIYICVYYITHQPTYINKFKVVFYLDDMLFFTEYFIEHTIWLLYSIKL